MKRKAFRKKFFNSGIYSFLGFKQKKRTESMRDKHAKIFGTIEENRICPTGVIKFNY